MNKETTGTHRSATISVPDLNHVHIEEASAHFADGGETHIRETGTDYLFTSKHKYATCVSDPANHSIVVDLDWSNELCGSVTLPSWISIENDRTECVTDYDYVRLALVDRAIDQLVRARALLARDGLQ